MSRIRIFPGGGGSVGKPMRRTMVELPFSELAPSISGIAFTVEKSCEQLLDQLTPHQRDVVIALICARYGNVERLK